MLALHGWGANAHDLIALSPVLNGGGALVLSPQGPVAFQIAQGILGFGWFPLTEGAPPGPGEIDGAREARERFRDAAAARYPIDPRKLVLMGLSQGGVMAYELALRDPRRFAGVIALSSWLPEKAAGIPAEGLDQLPVFVAHGTEDPMIPVARAQESRDRLTKLGVSVSYREYDMQHEIRPEALRDLLQWLEEKVISPIQLV